MWLRAGYTKFLLQYDHSAPAREEKTSSMLWDGWASIRLGLHTLSCVAFHLLSTWGVHFISNLSLNYVIIGQSGIRGLRSCTVDCRLLLFPTGAVLRPIPCCSQDTFCNNSLASCLDLIPEWRDKDGSRNLHEKKVVEALQKGVKPARCCNLGCQEYEAKNWCDADGTYGSGRKEAIQTTK